MEAPDGRRYACPWITDSITVHSDGNVTCGVDDPFAHRSFGNIHSQPIAEILANPEFDALRQNLWEGRRCRTCHLFRDVTEDGLSTPPPRASVPKTLVIEPTVKCNIRCANMPCLPNNAPGLLTRDSAMLDPEALRKVLDHVSGSLTYIYYFNYGEPFVHPRATDMLQMLRDQCPDAQIVTSTNGIPLAPAERARAVAQAAPDTIVFTIAGTRPESYRRYHGRGNVEQAIAGMIGVAEACKAIENARTSVVWRYLVFNWNDSDAEIEEAIRLANANGIVLSLYLTHIPPEGISHKFAPGTPNFRKYRRYIACSLTYAEGLGFDLPSDDGFYSSEVFSTLGQGRWSASDARMVLTPVAGEITFKIATLRPLPSRAFVITPWATYKVSAPVGVWHTVRLDVPAGHRSQAVEVTLATPDVWWPFDDGLGDKRCLGVIVGRDDPAPLSPMTDADRSFLATLLLDQPIVPLPGKDEGGRMPDNPLPSA